MTSRFLCWNWNASLLDSTSGYNFNWRNTGKDCLFQFVVYSSMVDGRQKSKDCHIRQSSNLKSFGAQRIRETANPLQLFAVDESNVWLWRKNTRQRWAVVRRHERNSLDPRKDDFLKCMMQSSHSFMRDTGLDCLWVMIYFVRRR